MMIKKTLAALSLAVIVTAGGFAAASAEDAASTDDKPEVKVEDTSKAGDSKMFGGKLEGIGKLPRRFSVFTLDMLLGTPVFIARKTKDEISSGITDLVGENRNPLLLLPAATLSVPYGIVGGTISGPMYAAHNGWKHADDDSLSKEGFGLKKSDN